MHYSPQNMVSPSQVSAAGQGHHALLHDAAHRRYPGHQAAPSWWRARDSWDFLLMAGKVGHTPFLGPPVLILSSLRISVTWHYSLGFSQSRWEELQRPCLTLLSFSSVYMSAVEHPRSPALNTPISPDSVQCLPRDFESFFFPECV